MVAAAAAVVVEDVIGCECGVFFILLRFFYVECFLYLKDIHRMNVSIKIMVLKLNSMKTKQNRENRETTGIQYSKFGKFFNKQKHKYNKSLSLYESYSCFIDNTRFSMRFTLVY